MKIKTRKQMKRYLKYYERINKNLKYLNRQGINPLLPEYRLKIVKSGKKVYFKLEKRNNQLFLIGLI
jgi:biotin-(acetyl-CoA carboxylase) ligase